MANERRLGRYFTVKWGGVAIGGIKTMSVNIDGEAVDITDADSGRFTNVLTGRKNATFDITCNYVQDDATQLDLTTDILAADSEATISFGPSDTPAAGDVTYSGDAVLTNVNINADEADVVEISFTAQVNGELTKTVTSS